MNVPGPIALIGGGEHTPPMTPVDRRLLDLVGAPRPRVVVFPQAPSHRQLARTVALARNHWTRLGASFRIAMPEHDMNEALDAVADADIVVIPGGHPDKLIAGLGASTLTDLMIGRWIDGLAIAGSSAGAMGLFEWRIKLYPPNPLRLLPGLGALDGYVAAPHFDRFRAGRWAHRVLDSFAGLHVLGLDEQTALVGHNGDFDVLGLGSVTIVDDRGTAEYPNGSWVSLDLLTGSRSRLDGLPKEPTSGRPELTLVGASGGGDS
ncbi:MAG TPA: Type 1 glutamine amidotransferase-like domain-containing protein [Acidimicrobiia bacterium]|nr:Type 1 glutamine amidotransferase-like domain-containing protein [Acidimicrobiia bacterium]